MGHELWRELKQIVFLDLNMRSQGPLATLLHQMRVGSISPEIWRCLESRVLRPSPDGRPDPRLRMPPFSNNPVHCIVHRHSLRVPLAYSTALQTSTDTSELFYILHACDEVLPVDAKAFDAEVRRRVLSIPNPRHTGKLPGVLPLCIGMRFTLYNCKDCVRLGLMNGAEVELLQILFAPPEWDGVEPHCTPGDLNVLRYMPQALLLRAVAASWTLPTQCQLPQLTSQDRTGVFLLKPVTTNFVYKDPASPSRSFRITRTTFPVLPSTARVVYAAQGETWPAVIADLACPAKMSPEVHWLANYVMLSRATSLDGILLLRNAERHELERGPPTYLIQELDRLRGLEADCLQHLRERLVAFPHVPDEILQLFESSTAATQLASHQRIMAERPRCNDAPSTRIRGKQTPSSLARRCRAGTLHGTSTSLS